MNDRLINPVIAVVLGVGTGMLLSVFGQKLLNQHYLKTCHDIPNHNLILIRGFLGDTYFCVKDSYLVPSK